MTTHTEIQTEASSITKLRDDGIVAFKKMIPPEKIQHLIQEIKKIKAIVMLKIQSMDRPLNTYSDIAERHLGRLDYRCGFNAEIFDQVAEPIFNLIKQTSPTIDFKYYWGVVTSLGGSEPTDMHRDVYPILNTTAGVNLGDHDISLPPYYFTVLIPLVEITRENGPTEFIKRSHYKKVVDDSREEIYSPLLSPGDFVIFEGRTLHRGAANKTEDERLIAYITFIAKWYNDQTFITNNYLFPELAIKCRVD